MYFISPNGKIKVKSHPSQVYYYERKGWKEEAAPESSVEIVETKRKSSSKKTKSEE